MFIKELKLSKVEGFKYKTKIEFKNEQNELIDFYLENTDKIKEGEKYINKFSDRIQINCILGKNGAGKTKLLSNIMHFFKREKFDLENEKNIKFSNIEYEGNKRKIIIGEEIKFNDRDSINSKITDNSSVIYDDFFVGSDMLNNSVHEDVLGDLYYGHGLNEFYCEVYNFLKKETHKGIFSEFLNLPNTYKFSLGVSININTDNEYDNKNLICLLNFINSYKLNEKLNNFRNLYDSILENEINTLLIVCSNQIFILLNNGVLGTDKKFTFEESKIIFDSFVNYLDIISEVKPLSFSTLSHNGLEKFRKNLEEVYNKIEIYKSQIYNNINNNNLFEELNISNNIKLFYEYNDEFLNYLNSGLIELSFSINKGILTNDEVSILSLNIFSIDLFFYEEENQKDGTKKITQEKSFNHLSSGEKIMLIRFVNVYKKIIEENEKNGKKHFVILIDEPDLHLHLEWQQVYIQRLIDIFSTIGNDITMHFIIATHSPFIISDLPKENIIKLVKKDGKLTEVEKVTDETFGANYIDIIRNGFFDGVFLGNFSKEIIGKIADKRRKEITNDEKIIGDDLKVIKKIEKQIGDEFLRDNLLYFKPKKDDKN